MALKDVLGIPGAKEVMIAFFCYCAIEQTAGLWAASYLTVYKGVSPQTAAFFASMFFIGITAGRAVSGFITLKLNDDQMVRFGQLLIAAGAIVMLLPGAKELSLAGLVIIGLGCAPVYPSMLHGTPKRFGEDKSQAIIGVQMASAYIGTCLMPPLFGLLAENISASLLPIYLMAILVLMAVMFYRMTKE